MEIRDFPECEPIRIFGCTECSILLITYQDNKFIKCPNCKRGITVFADYNYVLLKIGAAVKDWDIQALAKS
jgi:hypothetical protein